MLDFLDSLRQASVGTVIIAVPATDFTDSLDTQIMDNIDSNASVHIIVTEPSKVKKQSGEDQSKLFSWLTHDAENGHFNEDVSSDDQMYLISESGVLYALLKEDASVAFILELLQQQDIKE